MAQTQNKMVCNVRMESDKNPIVTARVCNHVCDFVCDFVYGKRSNISLWNLHNRSTRLLGSFH